MSKKCSSESFAAYTLSEKEKQKITSLAETLRDHDFYSHPASAQENFCSSFSAITSTELREIVGSMGRGHGPDVLLLEDVPVDRPLPNFATLKQNVAAKGRVSETFLCGLTALMDATLQREPSSHQPDYLQQIYPVESFEVEASGRGQSPLPFHAENVFLENPPSFLALLCLQGQAGVCTEYLPVGDILARLDEESLERLKAPLYRVRSGDGFSARALSDSPILDAIGNGWTISRIYEEDRIHTDDRAGQAAVRALKEAIAEAKAECVRSVELTSGTALVIANGVAKGRFGGVLHGRKGQITAPAASASHGVRRWLQRACIEVDYI